MSDFKPMPKSLQLKQKPKEKKIPFGMRKNRGDFGKKPSKPLKRSGFKNRPHAQKKPKRYEIVDTDYMDFVATFRCCITHQKALRGTGANNIHVHHIDGRNGRRNDYNVVPLMGYVHSWGEKSYHSSAKSDFMKNWFTDLNLFDGHEYSDPKEYFREVSLMINNAYLSRYCWDIETKEREERK